nr:MAG TPA: hypothetical protein [Caudoviricetes sp.]
MDTPLSKEDCACGRLFVSADKNGSCGFRTEI